MKKILFLCSLCSSFAVANPTVFYQQNTLSPLVGLEIGDKTRLSIFYRDIDGDKLDDFDHPIKEGSTIGVGVKNATFLSRLVPVLDLYNGLNFEMGEVKDNSQNSGDFYSLTVDVGKSFDLKYVIFDVGVQVGLFRNTLQKTQNKILNSAYITLGYAF